MYIVRWLMGHPIIAAWFLAVIAILLNTGTNTDVATDHTATKLESASDSVSEPPLVEPSVLTTALIKGSKDKDQKLTTPVVASTDSTSTDSTTSNTQNMGDLASVSTSDQSADEQTADDPSIKIELIPTEQPQESEVSLAEETPKPQKASEKATSTEDLSRINSEEMLLMAREAYWNNGLDEASQIYMQLIKLEPEVIGHRGELGNVYWRQGYPKKAAELYSEISLPMIEQGNFERVANMVGFIGLFYPDRATEIHKRLQAEMAKSK